MTEKQKEAIKVLNKIKERWCDPSTGCTYLSEEDYMTILEAIWDNSVKEIPVQPYPFVPQPLEPFYQDRWITTSAGNTKQ